MSQLTLVNLSPEEQYIYDELSRYYSKASPERMKEMIQQNLDGFQQAGRNPFDYQYNEYSRVNDDGIIEHLIGWCKREPAKS